jgi:hypothetical protein
VAAVAFLGWHLIVQWRTVQETVAIRRRVAALPFTPPVDGMVAEDRLRAFLEVCRRTDRVDRKYQQDRANLKRANESDSIDANALAGSMAYIGELQDERARALEAQGMGTRELRWTTLRLCETAWGELHDPGPATGDTANAALFERYASEIAPCIDVKRVRQDLEGYRRAIRDGSP